MPEVIRIRMEAYDHAILDQSAQDIVDTAKRTTRKCTGRSPCRREWSGTRCCLGRTLTRRRVSSSRFGRMTRLIDIVEATAKTIEALNKLNLPAGVDIKIKASSR